MALRTSAKMFVVYVGVGDVCVRLAGPSCSVVKQTLRRPYIPDGGYFWRRMTSCVIDVGAVAAADDDARLKA